MPTCPEDERWWLATFHGPGGNLGAATYVDITTPPVWDGTTVRAVDLDLDVLEGESGRVWIDDEDEFAQHRVTLGYPAPVVAAAMRSCDRVQAAMTAGHAAVRREPRAVALRAHGPHRLIAESARDDSA